jgi:hypothetical protein
MREIEMDPITLLAAFGPLAIDLVKSFIGRAFPVDSYKPTSIAEWLQMQQLDLDRFKAMQDSGQDTGVPWANVLIRLQKPAYASLALLVWAYQETFLPGGATPSVITFAQAIGFWLFGDRSLFTGKAAYAKFQQSGRGGL